MNGYHVGDIHPTAGGVESCPMPEYSDAFNRAVKFILEHEGGYVNDPDDPGGETKYGISKRSYPDIDIASLTEERAIAIYFEDYWIEANCHVLPEPVAMLIFDAAVNQGHRRAAKSLQRAASVTRDGIVGLQTLRSVEKLWNHVPYTLIRDVGAARGWYYMNINEELEEKYGFGWMRRLLECYRLALQL